MIDFHIKDVDTGLRLAMAIVGMPRAGLDGHTDEVINWNTPPLASWRKALAAFAAKLEEQRLPATVLRPYGMRAHLSVSPLIFRSNLILVQDRLLDERVVVRHVSPFRAAQ